MYCNAAETKAVIHLNYKKNIRLSAQSIFYYYKLPYGIIFIWSKLITFICSAQFFYLSSFFLNVASNQIPNGIECFYFPFRYDFAVAYMFQLNDCALSTFHFIRHVLNQVIFDWIVQYCCAQAFHAMLCAGFSCYYSSNATKALANMNEHFLCVLEYTCCALWPLHTCSFLFYFACIVQSKLVYYSQSQLTVQYNG